MAYTITAAFQRAQTVKECVVCKRMVLLTRMKTHLSSSECKLPSSVYEDECIFVGEVTSEHNSAESRNAEKNKRLWRSTQKAPPKISLSPALVDRADVSNSSSDILIEDGAGISVAVHSEDSDIDEEKTGGDSKIVEEAYYLKYFKRILDYVFKHPDYRKLLTAQDQNLFNHFYKLSIKAQSLFVRLYLRRHKWLPLSKLSYPEIAEDLMPIVQELAKEKFLLSVDQSTLGLEELLKLLSVPHLRDLVKSFKLDYNRKQDDLVESLLNFVVCQPSVFGSTEDSVARAARKALGSCFKLSDHYRQFFLEIFTMYSPPDMNTAVLEDDPRVNLLQALLHKNLLIDRGEIKYHIACQFSDGPNLQGFNGVFRTREAVRALVKAQELESDMLMLLFKKKFEDCVALGTDAKRNLQAQLSVLAVQVELVEKPSFLLPFTAVWVYLRVLWHTVEAYQRLKNYQEAVNLLVFMLDDVPSLLCGQQRGKYWERLALNLDVHLKNAPESWDAIIRAFDDDHTTPRYALALLDRAERLFLRLTNGRHGQAKQTFVKQIDKMRAKIKLRCIQETVIQAALLGKTADDSVKNIFVSKRYAENGAVTTVHSVEEVALQHYKEQLGYKEGLHSEGAAWCTLFGLLCVNEIFASVTAVPDCYLFPHQSEPLDLFFSEFWSARMQTFTHRFDWLRSATSDELADALSDAWKQNAELTCSVFHVDCFEDLEQAQRLARCVGPKRLAQIFDRLARNYRHNCSGLPDLVMWNADTGVVKVAEVKGPGDRLSTKQRIWLSFFHEIGLDAEVCYVQGKPAKRLHEESAEIDG